MNQNKFDLREPKPGDTAKADLIAALVRVVRGSGFPGSVSFDSADGTAKRDRFPFVEDWWSCELEAGVASDVPEYSVVEVVDTVVDTEGQLKLVVKPYSAESIGLLAVNERYPLLMSGGGHVKLVRPGRIVLATKKIGVAGVFGDEMGPEVDTVEASDEGSGMSFIANATEYGTRVAYFTSAAVTSELAWFSIESGEVLEECGASVTARRLSDGVAECLGALGIAQEILEAGVEVFPCYSWHGVAWGGDAVDISPSCDTGDTVLARKANGKWFAIGSGHVNLIAVAAANVAENASGNFTAQVPHGSCVFTCVGGVDDYREKTIVAKAIGGDIALGDDVVLHWSGREWIASKSSITLGCGLTEDVYGATIVDNTVLAGTGLDPEGACALRVEQAIFDRLDAIEADLADIATTLGGIADTLTDHEARIGDLELCCYENTQAIRECCYGRVQMDVVYSVACVDGLIEIQSRCVVAQPCPPPTTTAAPTTTA